VKDAKLKKENTKTPLGPTTIFYLQFWPLP